MLKRNKIKTPNEIKIIEAFWEKHRVELRVSKDCTVKFMGQAFEMFNYGMRGTFLIFFERKMWRSKLLKE